MAGGEAEARAGARVAEGIIAKAAQDVLRDAEGPIARDAAGDAARATARDAAERTGTDAGDDLARTTARETLPVGDGTPRSLEQQLADPHVHPSNEGIVEPGYDPYGGEGGPDQFVDRYWDENGGWDGDGDWKWPPDDGAAPGTREFVPPDQLPTIDRIGGDGGKYFSPDGTPFGERALPPDRLNFERRRFDLDLDNPHLTNGDIRVERSGIAPWFGQPGGGVQYRFIGPDGRAISTGDLITKWGIFK